MSFIPYRGLHLPRARNGLQRISWLPRRYVTVEPESQLRGTTRRRVVSARISGCLLRAAAGPSNALVGNDEWARGIDDGTYIGRCYNRFIGSFQAVRLSGGVAHARSFSRHYAVPAAAPRREFRPLIFSLRCSCDRCHTRSSRPVAWSHAYPVALRLQNAMAVCTHTHARNRSRTVNGLNLTTATHSNTSFNRMSSLSFGSNPALRILFFTVHKTPFTSSLLGDASRLRRGRLPEQCLCFRLTPNHSVPSAMVPSDQTASTQDESPESGNRD